MNCLRGEFIRAGLYVFKHRNRFQLVSAIRPVPFKKSQQSLSGNITSILETISAGTKCTRAELAAKLLPPDGEEAAKMKATLAADLHWLIQSGHVIEMHNGILELPHLPDSGKKADKKRPR